MKFLRPLLALAIIAVIFAAFWFWWASPSRVDMADYAPADALVYIELNNLADVTNAIQQTDVWRAASPITGSKASNPNRMMTTAARAGIGPLEAVLFARSQIALVVVGFDTAEENDTLKVRPEIALIAETHTTSWRTKSAAVEAVKKLANLAYGNSACSERSGDADYVECSAAGAERKVVGALDGTLVVIGNTDSAVRAVLDVRRGNRPSMRTDPELLKVRASVMSEKSLGFGYVSPANSAKLFSWVTPLLMGHAPGDESLEQLLAVSAGKILRGVAWSATAVEGKIEDRFLFSLESGVVTRLQPAFETGERDESFWKVVPEGFQSLTIYRNKAPATAWSSLDAAVSLKLDALPAVLFGSLLRSTLTVYGITNPREALGALSPPLLTLRPSANAEGSILVARVIDEPALRRSLAQEVFKEQGEILEGLQATPNREKEFAAVFADGYVLLGKSENMTAALSALRSSGASIAANRKDLQESASKSSATIVTYANDQARLNNFIHAFFTLQGRQLTDSELAELENIFRRSGFSSTETRLNENGIERTTRSAFGQFGTFLSLLQANTAKR